MRALGSRSRFSALHATALAALALVWSVLGEHGVVLAQSDERASASQLGEPDGEATATAADGESDEGESDDEELEWPGDPQEPFYATWWFWTAIGAVVLGVTLSIVVGLTTDDPVSGRRAGLELRFGP